jgi:antitoxin CptB
MDSAVDRHELSRLRWRCRRGLLENDLLIERFFFLHGPTLTAAQARALSALMELGDNELLDLLLGRTEPAPPLAGDEVRQMLALLRPRPVGAVPTIATSNL